MALACISSLAPPAWAEYDSGLDDKTKSYIQDHVDNGFLVGVSLGILKDGQTHTLSFGQVAPNSGIAPDGDSVYEIGSITKVFTGVLLALLVDEGSLRLDQPIVEVMAECPAQANKGRPISFLDLAAHRSGMPRNPQNLEATDPLNPFAGYTIEQFCAFLTETLPKIEPTQEMHYSNAAMGLLGRLIAWQKGLSWSELFQRELAGPLGMESTGVALTPSMLDRLVKPFDREGTALKNWDIPIIESAGALKSTVNDLLRFIRANFQNRNTALSRAMSLAREAPRSLDPGLSRNGLGWLIRDREGIWWHTGGTGGYFTFVGLNPEKEIGVVVLANVNSYLIEFIGLRVIRALTR